VLTLLENPERLGYANVPKVPAQWTEIRMRLTTKISLVYIRKQLQRIRPRLFHCSADIGGTIHAQTLRSKEYRCSAREASYPTMQSSGMMLQSSPAHSRSEAITAACGKMPASLTQYKDGAAPILAKRDATIISPSVSARLSATRTPTSSAQASIWLIVSDSAATIASSEII